MQLWLADQNPEFDRPGVYRRAYEPQRAGAKGWDAVLIGMVSLLLIFIGIAGLLAGIFMLGVIVSTWLS